MIVIILINILLNILCVKSAIIMSLNEYEWILTEEPTIHLLKDNKLSSLETTTSIPNGIYSILREHGKLPEDILYGSNDVQYRWIGKKSWYFSVWFPFTANASTHKQELIFHGLDGEAEIFLNKKSIGKTKNSFVRYRFDVTGKLKPTNNILTIAFSPPVITAKELSKRTPQPSLLSAEYISKWNGEKHVNFLRRMQASFGSDFGPAFPSVGIWKNIELVSYTNDIIIRDIIFSSISRTEDWNVSIRVYIDRLLDERDQFGGTIKIHLILENDEEVELTHDYDSLYSYWLTRRSFLFMFSVSKNDVKEWWPNGYGNQYLYPLTVTFSNQFGSSEKTIQVGFRTIDLIQDYVDFENTDQGNLFYFAVNGVPVFAKGANFLPVDILPEKASDKQAIEHLVHSAKIANMNMLRVHALGIYQSDYFYELCDKNGILIWHDMMFYASMYPTNEEFLDNIGTEIAQQVKRLQYHPSIALWVGNCESESFVHNISWRYKKHVAEYQKNIRKLQSDIRRVVTLIDYDNPYLDSTPHNHEDSYIADDFNKFLEGDVHIFLSKEVDSWLSNNYPIVRFASEYGVQSFPSLETFKKVANEKDLSSIKTNFMKQRQHSLKDKDNEKILHFIELHFGKVKPTDVENFIYVSQIEQAWSVKLQTEFHRKMRNAILGNGSGRTMGTLFWHLNDVWPAPSWSSIEYDGKWKMLHYYAKKFFSPVLVSVDMNKNELVHIYLISDLLYDQKVDLKIEIFKWDQMEPVSVDTTSVLLPKQRSLLQDIKSIKTLFDIPQCKVAANSKGNCFLKVTLIGQEDNNILSDNYLFPSYFKNLEILQDPEIEVIVTKCSSTNVCSIEIKTNAIALFVWLEVKDIAGYFSDNGFIMTNEYEYIDFHSQVSIIESELKQSLSFKVLSKSRLEKFV